MDFCESRTRGGASLKIPETIWFEHTIQGTMHWYPSTQNKLNWTINLVGDDLGDNYLFITELP